MKNLFIPENSGYGRFVTVTVNGKPYTVPVGVNVSVPDEVYSVVMESLKRPEMYIVDKGLYSVPTDIALTNNILQLTANGSPVGVGVKINEEWELIDELIVETNEEPVISWFIDIIGRGYKKIWVTGELYSSDTTTATQTIMIGGCSAKGTYGGTYVQLSGTGFTGGRKNFISAFLTVTPIDTIIGEISIGTNAASNANGGYIKSCGNFVGEKYAEIHRPMIKFASPSQQFAAGTKLQMWGCK